MNRRQRTITAKTSFWDTGLLELFKEFRLLVAFARRDIKIKYAQTYAGIFWAVSQPIMALVLVSVFFGNFIGMDTGLTPYPIFSYSGLFAWYYFIYLSGHSGLSLIGSADLVRKTAFPKLVLPFSKAISGLLEFSIWFAIMIGLIVYYQYPISAKMLLFPFVFVVNVLCGLTVGIWISAISIRYRDLYQVVPYLIGMTIFVTPVVYPMSAVGGFLKYLLYLNPMSGTLEAYRWVLLGNEMPGPEYLLGVALLFIMFFAGLLYFKRVENKMADLV